MVFWVQAEPDHGVNTVFVKLGDTKIEVSMIHLHVTQQQMSYVVCSLFFEH